MAEPPSNGKQGPEGGASSAEPSGKAKPETRSSRPFESVGAAEPRPQAKQPSGAAPASQPPARSSGPSAASEPSDTGSSDMHEGVDPLRALELGIPPQSFQAIRTPGDLLPAVSGDGPDSAGEPGSSSAPPPAEHRPGEVIDGRYVLTRQIDEGGMGVVWVAHSLQLEVDVAVKLLPSRRSTSVAAERMAREARAVAKLTHPAVVRIYDFGRTEQGDPYLAMELLQGNTLGSELDDHGPLEPVDAVRLLLPIADALATAHDCGIVHRDLKPDNIFLARAHGRIYPKLLDFSLVKLIPPGFSIITLTHDGRGLGTAPYLSPEQVMGQRDVDRRADVWSLCAVLYRTTVGRAPFSGAGRYEVMRAVVEANPTPSWKVGVADKAFWRILRRGLRKKPEDRYPDMRELGRELAHWLLDQGITEDAGHVALRSMWLGETTDEIPIQPAAQVAGSEAPGPRRRLLKSTVVLCVVAAAGALVGSVLGARMCSVGLAETAPLLPAETGGPASSNSPRPD
jgi:hypothetical protein